MEYDIDRLVPELVKRRVQVQIITRQFERFNECEFHWPLHIYRVPWTRGKYFRNYTFNFFSFFKALEVIKKEDIKVVHSVGVVASIIAVILKALTGVKVFAEPRGCQLRTWYFPFNWLLGLQERLVYPLCDKVGFQSKQQANEFEQAFGMLLDNKVIVPTGIELDVKTDPKRIRKEFNLKKKFVVTFIGRLEKVKGVEYLIEAMESVDKDVALLLVGSGSEELRLWLQAHKTNKTIRFLGWRDDTRDILAASNAFILPSLSEGVPTALLEAMAERVPCITTVKGFPVYHIEPKTPEDIAYAITTFKKKRNIAKQLAFLGRKFVEKHYSIEECVEKYIELYEKIAIKSYND
jgi:glycosyltransferase involved in cell wall biosynthesis